MMEGPACALPDAADDVDGAEGLGDGHKVDAGVQQPVQRAGDRQQDTDHTAEDDDRDEVGHIQHQLDLLFDLFALDAVEQESQDDGDGEAPQQAVDAQLQGIDPDTAGKSGEDIKRWKCSSPTHSLPRMPWKGL